MAALGAAHRGLPRQDDAPSLRMVRARASLLTRGALAPRGFAFGELLPPPPFGRARITSWGALAPRVWGGVTVKGRRRPGARRLARVLSWRKGEKKKRATSCLESSIRVRDA